MRKTLLISISLTITTSLMASNWVPHSKILAMSNEAHQLEQSCKSISGEKCYDIADYPSKVYSEKVLKLESESCETPEDCQEILESKKCQNGVEPIKNLDSMDVYCPEKTIVLDTIKVTALNNEKQIELLKIQSQAIKNHVKQLRECLVRVIDILVIRNSSKNLTTEQVEQMVNSYQPFINLLYAVSGVTAKEKIQEAQVDGVILTQSDKEVLSQEIDKCLGN